jgi:hypothetical protein
VRKIQVLVIISLVFFLKTLVLESSKGGTTLEQMELIREIQDKLNLSFQCAFSVSIGETKKFATGNSSGIIIVDRGFLQTGDRDRVFFAVAHEYAHAYLQHDLQIYDQTPRPGLSDQSSTKLVEIRRQFEKEADGIAARKAKQMGFRIESILGFILSSPDPERGIPPENRVYSRPRERAEYILAVYQSS